MKKSILELIIIVTVFSILDYLFSNEINFVPNIIYAMIIIIFNELIRRTFKKK